MIDLARGQRAVVSLRDLVSPIVVRDAKQTPFAVVTCAADLPREGSIQDVDLQLAPAVHLKHTLRRTRAQDRHVQPRAIQRVMDAVKTALDMREPEIRE